jgi:addiction module HigA family antidote
MNRLRTIVNGKRAITVDAAIRLGRSSGTSPQYWLNLQKGYDLEASQTRDKFCRGTRDGQHVS